jgi:hypothetical protein
MGYAQLKSSGIDPWHFDPRSISSEAEASLLPPYRIHKYSSGTFGSLSTSLTQFIETSRSTDFLFIASFHYFG